MAEINKFDDYLKDALSNLGEDVSPGDWDAFSEKLSATDGMSLDESSDFDNLIRNQMEDLEVNADANYWEVMESKIDQEINTPEISDEALDQLATDNLSRLHIPYNPTHWTLLSHRLEEEFNVRRKIVTYKLVEFSLMVLLLLTIIQFMPYPTTVNDKNIVTAKEQTKSLEANGPAISNAETTINTTPVATVIPTANKNINSAIISDNINHSINLPATIILGNEDNNSSVTLTTTIPSEIVFEIVENQVTTKEEDIKIPLLLDEASSSVEQSASSSLTELPVTISTLDHQTDWSAIGLIRKFPQKLIVRLGAMTSADINYIRTPSTSRYKNNGYQQYQLGYGGGITVDLNYEKLTLSTGLIYRRINYYPQEEINIAGSFANGYQSHLFDAVNLNLLTIPMNLQFQVSNDDRKWKIHAVTGASLNVLALNHYNITTHNLGPSSFPGLSPQAPPSSNTPDEIFREADIAGEGLFEGGSFERNHYYTANLGVGVERFISPRWSLYIQPIYQVEIFGKDLGLNRDRINTFSVQIGAKSTFK